MKIFKTIIITLVVFVFATVDCQAGAKNSKLEAEGFVDVTEVVPGIVLDIRYATDNNFTGQKVYPCPVCYLRKDVALKLAKVQGKLKTKGLGLKVYDCYRPYRVQEKFWELIPDERYVAEPKRENGEIIIGSRHNRGAAVDVGLVDKNGKDMEMPTGFDDFTPKAKPDYEGGTEISKANRQILMDAMEEEGFSVYPTEWWHYDAPEWEKYPMLDLPLCPGES